MLSLVAAMALALTSLLGVADIESTKLHADRIRMTTDGGGGLALDIFLVHDDMVLHFRGDKATKVIIDGEDGSPEMLFGAIRKAGRGVLEAAVETERDSIRAKVIRVWTK